MTALHVNAFLINRGEGVSHIAKYDPFGEIAGSWCGQTNFDIQSNVPWGNPRCEACVEQATAPAEDLAGRLKAAEDVCVLFSWLPSVDTKRGKAAHELWRKWMDLSGNDCTADSNPHLTDELIAELAQKRDATRAATLERIFGGEVQD